MTEQEIDRLKKMPIVFIIGNGRSGTTVVQEALSAHPNVISYMECDFVLYLYPKFGKITRWNDKTIHEFVEALFGHEIIREMWMLDKQKLISDLLSLKSTANYALACKTVFYQTKGDKNDILLISDKYPNYSLFPLKLLRIFPEAKFIHIVRDPRDNVNARIKRLMVKNVFFNSWQWVGYNKSIERIKKKLPHLFFSIIYEKMVHEPEKTFIALCAFLNIPYNNSMLNLQFNKKLDRYKDKPFFETIKSVQQSLLSSINTSNIGKWQKEMSPHDVAVTESITGKFAKENYGYNVREKKDIRPKISVFKLLKTHIVFSCWTFYTRLRHANIKLNTWHKNRKGWLP
jgi:hypothetical protein